MTYTIEQLITQPELPLQHRIRPSASGNIAGSPCLILLHGVGANELSMQKIGLAQDHRLTVILVRSPLEFGPMQFGFFQVRFTENGPMINAAQAELARQQLVDFITGLPGIYDINPQQVWIAGFSQGGILSASVGLTRPDLVKGVGILSGRILNEIAPHIAPTESLRYLQAFVSHGVHDNKLSVEYGRNSRNLLTENQVNLTYREYEAAHEWSDAMHIDFKNWLIKGLDS